MSDYEFPTAGPIKLYAELGKGSLSVRAEETTTTRVDVTGDGADEVRVTREGDQVSIIAPHTRTGFLGREPSPKGILEVADMHVPFLQRKAERIEEYLQQH